MKNPSPLFKPLFALVKFSDGDEVDVFPSSPGNV
jgi:hypothetical protein